MVWAQNEDEAATDRLLLSVMENLDEDEEVGPAGEAPGGRGSPCACQGGGGGGKIAIRS